MSNLTEILFDDKIQSPIEDALVIIVDHKDHSTIEIIASHILSETEMSRIYLNAEVLEHFVLSANLQTLSTSTNDLHRMEELTTKFLLQYILKRLVVQEHLASGSNKMIFKVKEMSFDFCTVESDDYEPQQSVVRKKPVNPLFVPYKIKSR